MKDSIIGMTLFLTVALLFALASPTLAYGPNNSLCWDKAPDGDLAGYWVYFGTKAGTYGPPVDVQLKPHTSTPACGTKVGMKLSDIGSVPNGSVFVGVTAYDTSGNESGKSVEISFPFDGLPPSAPINVLVK